MELAQCYNVAVGAFDAFWKPERTGVALVRLDLSREPRRSRLRAAGVREPYPIRSQERRRKKELKVKGDDEVGAARSECGGMCEL